MRDGKRWPTVESALDRYEYETYKEKKIPIYQRDGGCCQKCGRTGPIYIGLGEWYGTE